MSVIQDCPSTKMRLNNKSGIMEVNKEQLIWAIKDNWLKPAYCRDYHILVSEEAKKTKSRD